jgi:hypothetical protein
LAEALRVEAPSEDLAHALMARLQAYPTELQNDDGRIEVRVALVGKADRAIVEVLDGVDAWLVDCDVHATRVHLDKRVYTLTAPNWNGR